MDVLENDVYNLCLLTTPNGVQELLLPLCLRMTPGGVQRTIFRGQDRTRIDCQSALIIKIMLH